MTTTGTEASNSPADEGAGHEAAVGPGDSHRGAESAGAGPSTPGVRDDANPAGMSVENSDNKELITVTTRVSENGKAQEPPQVLSVARRGKDELPLVLVTFGNAVGEFEAMYDHLDTIDKQRRPGFQTLIVARPDVSSVVLRVLAERVRSMPTVHLRKLGKTACSALRHETGTFFVTPDKRLEHA